MQHIMQHLQRLVRLLLITVTLIVPTSAGAQDTRVFGYGDEGELFYFPIDDPNNVTIVGPGDLSPLLVSGLEFHGNGNLYAFVTTFGLEPVGLYVIDTTTGTSSFIGNTLDPEFQVRGMAYDPVINQLVIVCDSSVTFEDFSFTVDVNTGAATLESVLDPQRVRGIGVDACGDRYALDLATLRVRAPCGIGSAPAGPALAGGRFELGIALDWSRDGSLYYTAFLGGPSLSYWAHVDFTSSQVTDMGTVGTNPTDNFWPRDVAIEPSPTPAGAPAGCVNHVDCNEDTVPDYCEIAADVTLDLDFNGIIDLCDFENGAVDCNSDGDFDFLDRFARQVVDVPFSRGSINCGDFDGDGRAEIFVLLFNGEAQILQNDGLGNFSLGVALPTPGVPFSQTAYRPTVADINSDSFLDISYFDFPNHLAFFGDGMGGFSQATPIATGDQLRLGDLNGDNQTDLVTVSTTIFGPATVQVRLADGQGDFLPTMEINVPFTGRVRSTELVDLNGDGHLDFMSQYLNTPVTVMLGDGTGVLLPPISLPIPNSGAHASFLVSDVDLDGRPDVVDYNRTGLRLFGNVGDLDFTLWDEENIPSTAPAFQINDLCLWDANNDGFAEVVVRTPAFREFPVYELRNREISLFGTLPPVMRPWDSLAVDPETRSFAVADFDGDGRDDVAHATQVLGKVYVYSQLDDDCDLNGQIDECDFLEGGDANSDSVLDACESVTFLRGDVSGDGVFEPLVDALVLLQFSFSGGAAPPCRDAADVNGNGVIEGITDVLTILSYQFSGGPPPAFPFPDCAPIVTGPLGCESPPICP